MLNIIGIGLGDKKDISLKGLEAVKESDNVFLDGYTSMLIKEDIKALEELYQKRIKVLFREEVEGNDNKILKAAKKGNTSFLVIGDGLSATTHIDLILRAEKAGIKTRVIHNASVLNAVGITGLSLYKFGQVCSIVFPEENQLYISAYSIIAKNKGIGLHTLALLDIKRNELTREALRKNTQERTSKLMTIKEAIKTLLRAEEKEKKSVFNEESLCVGLARLGSETQKIAFGKAARVKDVEFGAPPHCLIIPSEMHFMEEEALNRFKI